MADRWVVDADYPGGRLVPMTPAEDAQRERDQAAGAELAWLESQRETAALERLDVLRRARVGIAAGVMFSSLSASERCVLDALIAGALE